MFSKRTNIQINATSIAVDDNVFDVAWKDPFYGTSGNVSIWVDPNKAVIVLNPATGRLVVYHNNEKAPYLIPILDVP